MESDVQDLWDSCNQWGVVMNVYIAANRSKSGHRFGFVRFKNVNDINLLVSNLRVTWMGGFHLFADVAKYGRTNNRLEERSGDIKHNEGMNTQPVRDNANVFQSFNSYAKAVLGNKSVGVSGNNDASNSGEKPVGVSVSNKANEESSNEALMFISEDDCIDLDGMERSILAKVKDLSVITDLLKYMSSEGFVDVGLRYVGGRWVWLEFDSTYQVESVKNSKNLDDDVEKDIEDCSKNVTEKCGMVNNNVSNNVKCEILEDHFDGDRRNDTIEDNADVNPSTNVYLDVNQNTSIPEVVEDLSSLDRSSDKAKRLAHHNNDLDDLDISLRNRLLHQDKCRVRTINAAVNDSSIVSPSTPPGTVLNLAEESCSTWLDYVGPLITDELDYEKHWSYRDPDGNVQGSFSLAQLLTRYGAGGAAEDTVAGIIHGGGGRSKKRRYKLLSGIN
nr:nucleotide-binding alpha-beta plait domain-containing protein [Tanacetum cinerariifolium]